MGAEQNIRMAQSCAREPREAVSEVRTALSQPETNLVVFFCSSTYDLQKLTAEVARQFGDIPTVGCTTAGEIGPAGLCEGSITALSLAAGACTPVVGCLENLRRFQPSKGIAFARALRRDLEERVPDSGAHSTFAFLLVDGLFGHEELLAHSLQQGLGRIPLVGGSAGDNLCFEKTFVYWDGRFRSDAAVLVLGATPLPFAEFKTQHFQPTDNRLVVTEADPSQRLVIEINGRPAAEEYAHLLGIDASELNPARFAASPMVILIDGADYVRSIQKVKPDGSLKFYSAIERGVVLRVAQGRNLVANLETAFSQVRAQIGQPQLVLTFDCILRRLEIDQTGLREAVGEILRRNNAIGFSTYGEQFCGVHVNQTLTAIALGFPRSA